jgi:ABC-type nitrate/sulfonate/bicarbonate transport system substrate-binding protein
MPHFRANESDVTSTPLTQSSRNHGLTELWYSRCPVATATSVAIEQGFFDRRFTPLGLAVRSLRSSNDPAVRLAHYTNDHPAMFREGGLVPPLWTKAKGTPTTLLALGWISEFQGIIVRRDSPIVAGTDLRGARIGLPRRVGQPIDFPRAIRGHGIVRCLTHVGLHESDVELVDLVSDEAFLTEAPPTHSGSLYTARENARSQTIEILALVRGEVDAIFTSGGYGREITELIDARVVVELPGHGDDAWGNHLRVLTVSTDLVTRHRELVVAYAAALFGAADWAHHHSRDAWRIVAAELGLAEEWATLGNDEATPSHLAPDLSDPLLDEATRRADYYHQRGFLERPVDFDAWLDPTVIDEVRQHLARTEFRA